MTMLYASSENRKSLFIPKDSLVYFDWNYYGNSVRIIAYVLDRSYERIIYLSDMGDRDIWGGAINDVNSLIHTRPEYIKIKSGIFSIKDRKPMKNISNMTYIILEKDDFDKEVCNLNISKKDVMNGYIPVNDRMISYD